MPLRQHLLELRRRLFLAALGLVVGAVVGWFLYDPVLDLLQQPLRDVAQERDSVVALNFAGVATSFDMKIKVSLFLGVFVSSPWWLYQLWAFVAPALHGREKKYAYAFAPTAGILFVAGAALAYTVTSLALQMLFGFLPEEADPYLTIGEYLNYMLIMMGMFGLGFVMPLLVVLLLGVLTVIGTFISDLILMWIDPRIRAGLHG